MEEKEVKTEKPQKLTYEQLENVAHQLSEQSKDLYTKLQESNMENVFMRLKFLFEVVKNKDSFSKEFVSKCTLEIETIMTIPEEVIEDTKE